jgi:hypothetical protein
MKELILQFPPERSIGTLSMRKFNSRDEWVELSQARGTVVSPAEIEIKLFIDPLADFDPALFSHFEPEALTVFGWVSTSRVTNGAIKYLQHLRGLRGLSLWETSIGDEALSSIRWLYNLHWLDIGDTKVTDDGLEYLSELSSLDGLTLLNDEITDRGLVHLQRLKKLSRLDLMNTLVTDDSVEALSRLASLKSLRIYETGMTEKGYRELKTALPKCRIRFHHPHRV